MQSKKIETAQFMDSPVGPLPIPDAIVARQSRMDDREIADAAFASRYTIDPFAFAELVERGLCDRGMFAADVYARIERRERGHENGEK